MDSGTKCINGSEISSILWKIGQDPWRSNFTSGFSQGDRATALLSVKLNDCDTFEGKTLEAFVQVPNTANDIVKMFATIDSDNKAIFTLPRELLWYPGDYNINFMYADGDKVNYSNVTNNAYKVISNPALARQTPPTILPSDKAEYEDLISRLNVQTTKAETQIPALKTENDRADILIPDAKSTNDALNLVNEEGKKVISDGNTAQTSWQDTIDNGDQKIGELNQKITEADDKITDVDNRIIQAEQEITDMETRVDDGVAKVDAAVNALPDEIKKITDETAAGIQSLQNQETTSKGNIDTHTAAKIGEIDAEATAKIGEIQTEGTNKKNELTAEGNKQKSEIITEGGNQKTLVKNQGDSSLAAVVKVEEDVKKILVDNPGSLNALSLSGKTRVEFDDEITENTKQIQNLSSGYQAFELGRALQKMKQSMQGFKNQNTIVLGDSITYGQGASEYKKSWSSLLYDKLKEENMIIDGYGFINNSDMQSFLNENDIVKNEGSIDYFGFDRQYKIETGQSLSFNKEVFNYLGIYYWSNSAGVVKVKLNGVEKGSYNIVKSTEMQKIPNIPIHATGEIEIYVESGRMYLQGIDFLKSGSYNCMLNKFGYSGKGWEYFSTDMAITYITSKLDLMSATDEKLIITALGTNEIYLASVGDGSGYTHALRLESFVNKIREVDKNIKFLFLLPARADETKATVVGDSYYNQIKYVTDKINTLYNVSFVTLQNSEIKDGANTVDGVHPNDYGHNSLASTVAKAIKESRSEPQYAINNIQVGTADFNGKTDEVTITFDKPFDRVPKISLTRSDGVTPARDLEDDFVIDAKTKTELIIRRVNSSGMSLSVDWIAMS